MSMKIHPLLWPVLVLGSPIIVPLLMIKNKRFIQNKKLADDNNRKRIEKTVKIDLTELESAELKVIVEHQVKKGYESDPGVSYLFTTNEGTLLYDIGFGASNKTFEKNLVASGIPPQTIDALAISHFHPDHCGGMKASKKHMIYLPSKVANAMKNKNCYIPEKGNITLMNPIIVERPQNICAGIASTGPLTRSLFFFGLTEEQALIFNLKDKGLLIFTGCGHPTIEVILKMVRKISDIPIYAIGGGLHFPIKNGRGNYLGIQAQRIIGTGKKPWENITEKDIQRTIQTINDSGAKKVFLSPHDSCDYALTLFKKELNSETYILTAGETYQF